MTATPIYLVMIAALIPLGMVVTTTYLVKGAGKMISVMVAPITLLVITALITLLGIIVII